MASPVPLKFRVKFDYEGPKGNPEIHACSAACWKADATAEELLTKRGFTWEHAYSFPDGSLCKTVDGFSADEVKKQLGDLPKPLISVDIYEVIDEVTPDA